MMKTHAIHPDSECTDALVDVWTMLCGAQCISFEDGSLAPEGFDFYEFNWAHKAECQECKDALALRASHVVAEAL